MDIFLEYSRHFKYVRLIEHTALLLLTFTGVPELQEGFADSSGRKILNM